MKYKSVIVTKNGGPEVLQIIENELRPPLAGEARIRVLAAAVCRPDITVRAGKALYSGTPLGQKVPFTPGYAIIDKKFPILEAAQANALLESGQVTGNLVLVTPELL